MFPKTLAFNTKRGYSAQGQTVEAVFVPRAIDDNGDQVGAIEFVDVTRGIDGRYNDVRFTNREITDGVFQARVMDLYDKGGYVNTKWIKLEFVKGGSYGVNRDNMPEPKTPPVTVPEGGHKFGLINRTEAIKAALDECFVGGHVSHIRNPENGRVVAIRPWYLDNDDTDNTFSLTFSDPIVDLRSNDELGARTWGDAARLIYTFMIGDRCNEKRGTFSSHINQADRDCDVVKLTPTRARIEYWLPNSGITGAWRQRTTVGGWHYLRSC